MSYFPSTIVTSGNVLILNPIANQGVPAVVASGWPVKITDGVNTVALTGLQNNGAIISVPAGSVAPSGLLTISMLTGLTGGNAWAPVRVENITNDAIVSSTGTANFLGTASHTLVFNGTSWDRLRGDSVNGILVSGNAFGSTATTSILSPSGLLQVGGQFNGTPPTLVSNQASALQLGTRGSLAVQLMSPNSSTLINATTINTDGVSTVQTGIDAVGFNYVYHPSGNTWDRLVEVQQDIQLSTGMQAHNPMLYATSGYYIRSRDISAIQLKQQAITANGGTTTISVASTAGLTVGDAVLLTGGTPEIQTVISFVTNTSITFAIVNGTTHTFASWHTTPYNPANGAGTALTIPVGMTASLGMMTNITNSLFVSPLSNATVDAMVSQLSLASTPMVYNGTTVDRSIGASGLNGLTSAIALPSTTSSAVGVPVSLITGIDNTAGTQAYRVIRTDNTGNLKVLISSGASGSAATGVSADGLSAATGGLFIVNMNEVFNGSSWDRVRSLAAVSGVPGQTGIGTTAVTDGTGNIAAISGLPPVSSPNNTSGMYVNARIMGVSGTNSFPIGASTPNIDGLGVGAGLVVTNNNLVFNGATWDRARSANGDTMVSGLLANARMGYVGQGSFDRLRTPNVFKPQNSVNINTEATVWTPASGKKFRLMGGTIATSGTATGDIIFRDNTAGTIIAIVPTQSSSNAVPTTFNFGNGILSATANNVLTAQNTGAFLKGTLFGVEE